MEIQRKLAKFTKYLVWVGALQFVALILQAVVFYRTLRQIDRQAGIMDGHSQHLKDLATAASNNALAASLNAQAVINAERPWVSVNVKQLFNNTRVLNFEMTNEGRTPAEIISYVVKWQFRMTADDLPIPPFYGPEEIPANKFFAPRETPRQIFSYDTTIPPNDSERLAQLHNDWRFVFYGVVRYASTLATVGGDKSMHETRFCCWYSPTKRIEPVAGGPDEYNLHT